MARCLIKEGTRLHGVVLS